MVKLGGVARARAMTVLEKVIGEYGGKLAELEKAGYLEKPHTSSGRVPSAKGYRLYVNEL